MLDKKGKLKDCNNCGGRAFIDALNAKVFCSSCGFSVGYKFQGMPLPSLKLKEMLIELWNDAKNRKIKDAEIFH